MRKLKLFSLLCLLLIGVGQMWATDPVSTLTFTAQAGGKGTADDGVKWTVTSDGTESSYDATKGIHFGTSSAQVTYIQLATSEISGTITKVVVNASTASGVTASASVTVGGSAFGGDAKSLSTSATNYTFEGSASGEIIVRVAKPSKAAKAIYVKSVAVTYTSGGGGADPVDPTITFEDGSVDVGYTLDLSTLFTSNSNGDVTYSITSGGTYATIEGSVLTGVAAGSVAVQASQAATASYNAATANSTITVNEHVVTPGEYTINLTNTLFGTTENANITAAINASQNDISLVVNGTGSTKPRTDATYIRFYGSSSLTLSVPSGYNITKIVISANQSDYSAPSVNVGEFATSTKTWTGKANEVVWSFSAKSFIGQIKVTYAAIAPEVTVDPTSLSFDAKQNIAVDGKTFTLEGANLESGLTLAASTGFTVSPTSISAADAMAQGGAEVTVTPATPTATTTPVEGTVTISGGGLASDVEVALSMAVTPTYAVAIAVNDGDMGSATLNGGTASIYVTDDEEIALVATPESGHEFVKWTVSDENIVLDNENAATTTALAGAAGTITANFQQQTCQALAAPVLDEITKTYQSATIAWNAVDNADGYVLNIVKHEGGVAVLTDEVIVAPAVSFEKTGLAANTQYDYTVMAVGDGTDYCDESNPLLEGNFTTNDYPSVAVTYSENENSVSGGSKKIMTPFALPDEVTNEISGKTFVGWTTKSDFEDGDESDEETYFAKGANFTIQSNAAVTLYAVYATAGSGAGDTWVINKDNFSTVGTGSGYAPYNGVHTEDGITYNTAQVMLQSSKVQFQKNAGTMYNKTAFDADIVSIAIDGIDANITVYEGAEEISTGGTSITLADGVYPFSSGKRYFRIKMGNATGAATSITVNLAGATSYSDYVISGSAALPVLDAPTGLTAGTYYEAQTITLAATNDAAIYYSLDGNDPTVDAQHLYSEPFTLSERDVVTVKAIAVKSGYENSPVATAEYNINLPYDFADFAALTKENGKEYAVRGIISQIDDVQSGKLTYYISANGATEGQLKLYKGLGLEKATFSAVTDVNKGDNVTVVGTWSTQHSNLNQDNWMLEYTARVHDSYEIVGGLTSTTFQVGEAFDDAILGNMSVKEVFTNGYEETVAGATFNCGVKTEWLENETSLTVYAKLGDDDLTSKNFGVTVSSATLVSFELKAGYKTEYYVGDEFVKPTVKATLTDNTHPEAEATACTGYDMSAAGNYTVNVAFTYGDITIDEGVTYQITVKKVFDNEDAPHTVAIAKELIEPYTTTSTEYMWVRGIVSQVGSLSSGKLRYYISDNGSTAGQLYVFDGKYFNGANFTDNNKLQINDEVVVKAKAQNYQGSTLELTSSQVVSLAREVEVTVANVAELEVGQADLAVEDLTITTLSEGAVTLVSGDETKATIVDNAIHAVAAGEVTITANVAANGIYKAASAEFTVTVVATKDRYTVTFSTGEAGENVSGNVPEAIDDQLENVPVTLPACTWTWEGHKFTGWAVTYGENVPVEVENNQFNMPAANVTLTAQWVEVATCRISFMVGGVKKASIDKEQEVAFTIAQDGSAWAPTGFTFVGWATTEQAEETEVAPTTITEYTPQAGVAEVSLYGIYSRVEGDGETNHYVLDYEAEDLANNSSWGAYGTAYEHIAVDGGVWTIKAFKSSGMQINTTKSAYIKVPVCPANIKQIELTCNASAKKAVKFCATASDNAEALANGSEATAQTLDLSGKSVTTGYIIPTGNCQITHIDVAYDAAKAYYTSSPVEKVTITFDANGGEGGCQKAIINKGSELTICAEAPTKTHSEFAGWKNGDDVYEAGHAYTFNADITLTAQWNEAAKYTVTYAKGGDDVTGAAPTDENEYYAGDPVTLVAHGALAKDGYTFQGWKYGSKLYKAGASFTMPAEAVTFVAQWRKASVPVDNMSMVTSASALSNGMQIALGCSYVKDEVSYFVMAGDIASGKSFLSSKSENITLSDGVATYTDAVVVMTLEQVENGWKITKDGTNYLKETSAKNLAWVTENATVWTISFNGNNVLIEGDYATMKYNSASGQERFTTYSSDQKDIQLFGKAVVVTENASISDLGYTDGEAIVASGANVTLTIDEPTTVPSITAKDGATVVIEEQTTAKNVVVEDGSKIVANAETTTPTVYFATTMGSTQTPGTASELGSVTNITLATGGEIIYDLTLGVDMSTPEGAEKAANQWHAFTLPFPVDAINGIYNAANDQKLTNEVDYAIMDYHGDIRANGDYGWKKYRGILQPGVFYLMTVNGDIQTFRFKAAKTGAMTQTTSMGYKAYNGSGDPSKDFGWNGIGNPAWVSGTVAVNVQVLDPYSYTYQPLTINTNITVSTPFFYNAGGDGSTGSVVMQDAGAGVNYAPARTPANEIKNVAVSFGNEVFRDKIYISASEDALNEYEQDKDLVRMIMSNTPKVAQIFGNAYGMKLSMVNAPMSNNNAEVALTLYAPEAGEYTISVPEMENAEIYLTKDGAIIWNLTMSEYTNDFAKGNNEGYGLLLIKKITGISTGVENIEAAEAGVQKVVIDDKVFILRGEKMYDVTGKMVK